VAREVRAELQRVLGGHAPTVADLRELKLTTQVIEESLRLRPPAWIITRKAVAEDTLAGHTIPAGSNVIISPYLTHRHPKFWSNPEGFDPSRFSAESSKDRHPMAYMPFGGGPRKCIGMTFAMMEMQIALAMVLSSYDLYLVPGCEPEINPSSTLRPLDGCWMTVHRA
jgi:cytochrome P450